MGESLSASFCLLDNYLSVSRHTTALASAKMVFNTELTRKLGIKVPVVQGGMQWVGYAARLRRFQCRWSRYPHSPHTTDARRSPKRDPKDEEDDEQAVRRQHHPSPSHGPTRLCRIRQGRR